MTKTVCVLTALALLPACAREVVVAPVEAPVASAPTVVVDLPPPDPPRPNAFPAGPGVAITSDQLSAIVRDRRVTDRNVPWNERVALAEAALGPGEPYEDAQYEGLVWRGVSARTTVAPFGCWELVLSHKDKAPTWTQRSADHRACGLPYAADDTKVYPGKGPRRTVTRLQDVLAEVGSFVPDRARSQARMRLGPADASSVGDETWFGIGPRDRAAPITCHALHLGGRPSIEPRPLADCGLAWPMPGLSFEPGPTAPPLDKNATLASCNCATSEICMIDQRVPFLASIRSEPDGLRARYPDGKSAQAELVTSCVPVPATCTNVSASCFFPPYPTQGPMNPAQMAGPCPQQGYSGRAFLTTPSTHIMCYTRLGGPPLFAPAPPPPATKSPGKGPSIRTLSVF